MAKPKARSKTKGGRSSGGGRSPTVYTGSSKRVRDYLAKHPHATVAQARGHKPDEHRTRAERKIAAGLLTEQQRAELQRFARRQARRNEDGPSPRDVYRAMLERFDRRGGYRSFQAIKGQVSGKAKVKRHRHRVRRVSRDGSVATLEMAPYRSVWEDMQDYAEDHDIPIEWLYYH